MGTPELGALVAGGGIAGLTAALELQQSVRDVLVVDASDRPGGVMRTDHVSGFVIERGPNTFQVKAPMLEFLRRMDADGELLAAKPAARKHCLYRDGSLVRVPDSPWALARTPLLSGGAKLRMLAEPFVRRGEADHESVAEFVTRRLGGEVVSGLAGPFLTGVYAGDESELGAEAVFPTLVDYERRSGSIVGGALGAFLQRGRARGLRGSHSALNGLGPFARHLAERLVEPPVLESRVTGVRRDGEGWLVFITGPGGEQRLHASQVVIAAPAPQAAEILRGIDTDLSAALEAIEYAPMVSMSIGVDPDAIREPIDGLGFLVPRQPDVALLGCLYMSQLFPGRAPEGRELLQCMIGGVRWPEAVDLPDDQLQQRVYDDLDRILGLRESPQSLTATRWRRAIPQPRRDHCQRVAEIRRRVRAWPGLALAGAYLDGVGVSDSLASGLGAAREFA
jgi:oxygen-dependent protoporphyrinogen oxidase